MDDGRSVGVGKVYAPLGYLVALSPEDAEKFGGFTLTLAGELSTYLADHAREHGYHLMSPPHVAFDVHDDLRLGRFRVSAELAVPERREPPADAGAALEAPEWEIADASALGAFVDPQADGLAGNLATVTVGEDGHDTVLAGDRVTVGRLASCGIHLDDSNVSREHAAFVREGDGWAIVDLGSTNGTTRNGSPVTRAVLSDGDVVEIGVSRLTYHEPGR
jgi:hypothetical protein